MKKVICIKSIPHLCEINETGTIKSVAQTKLVSNTGWYNEGIWWTTKTLPNILEFNFKKSFNEDDFLRMVGKHIVLTEHFNINYE
ncbi:MAG: hypothetical protein ABIP51_04375 [Bacteroidia bacterium]